MGWPNVKETGTSFVTEKVRSHTHTHTYTQLFVCVCVRSREKGRGKTDRGGNRGPSFGGAEVRKKRGIEKRRTQSGLLGSLWGGCL